MDRGTPLTFKVDLPGGEARLREMILYVAERSAGSERLGKVKLNKILWRADFNAFAERRVPVTGRSYQKLAAGPAPVEMPTVLAEMTSQGLISFDVRTLANGYEEYRPVALASANLRFFSPDDIGFVDESIKFYWNRSATAASELSHKVAWRSRNFLDPIPYEAVLFSDEKPRGRMKERFAEIARSRGLVTL